MPSLEGSEAALESDGLDVPLEATRLSGPRAATSGPGRSFLAAALTASGIAAIGLFSATGLGALREIFVARTLGVADFGVISLAESLENVLIKVAPLGLTAGLPVLVAEARARGDSLRAGRALGTGLALGASLAVAAAVVTLVASQLVAGSIDSPAAGPTVAIWSLVIAGGAFCQVAAAGFRGLLRVAAATLSRDVTPNLLILGLVAVALLAGLGVPTVAWAYAAGALLAAIVAGGFVIRTARRDGLHLTVATDDIRPVLAYSIPVLTMLAAGQLIRQLNVPVLGAVRGPEAVGLFSAALFFGTAVEGLFTSVTLVFLPYVSDLLARGGGGLVGHAQASVARWLGLVTLGPVLLLSALPKQWLALLFGSAFEPAADALRIVLLGLLVQAYIGPRNSVLLAMHKRSAVTLSFVVALALAAVVTAVAVPRLGLVGAAISYAIAVSVRSGLSVWQLARVEPSARPTWSEWLAWLLLPVVVFAPALAGDRPVVALAIGSAAGVALFLVTFWGRFHEEWAVLREIVRRPRRRR